MSATVDGHVGVPDVEEESIVMSAREEAPTPNPTTAVKDAIQRAISPERVRFVQEDDGMLIFRVIDGIDTYEPAALQVIGASVVHKLRTSADPIVRDALARSDRIGIT